MTQFIGSAFSFINPNAYNFPFTSTPSFILEFFPLLTSIVSLSLKVILCTVIFRFEYYPTLSAIF